MSDINFAKRLKDLRDTRGIAQDTLAAALKVSRRTICAWENGSKLPSYDSIVALCLYFQVSADYLLGLQYD